MLSDFPLVIVPGDGSSGRAFLRGLRRGWQTAPSNGGCSALTERMPLPRAISVLKLLFWVRAIYDDMPELEEVPQGEPAPALPYHGGRFPVPDPPPGLDALPAWHSRWVRVMTAEEA